MTAHSNGGAIEPPGGPALLDVARRTLLEELLPVLPPDKHYAALMVANAMAIASRTARRDMTAAEGLDAQARALTGTADADPWPALAAAIRAGRFRPGMPLRAEAYAVLRAYAEARCALSSPKALKRTG